VQIFLAQFNSAQIFFSAAQLKSNSVRLKYFAAQLWWRKLWLTFCAKWKYRNS